MKYVLRAITATFPTDSGTTESYSFPLIPGTGKLSRKTNADGLTEEISLSFRLKWNDTLPDQLTTDALAVTVSYDKDGSAQTFTFGSADLPVRFQVTDNATRAVSCTYKRAI